MRAGWCVPGSAIVAGPSLKDAPDLFLGWAFQVKRRWGRTIVVDQDDREWHDGVWVLPPGSFRLCTAVQGVLRYPVARLAGAVGGLSPVPELAAAGLAGPPGNPGRVAHKSSATDEKDALSVTERALFWTEQEPSKVLERTASQRTSVPDN